MNTIVDVNERKIRPIYEAIDNCSYKPALQQCNKLLKKQPDALILKALKGLVLERMGKSDEALQLCNQVKEKNPTDEPILQALTMVYRSLGKHDEIVKIYDNATRKNPNNEELSNHWFMAMVRNSDFKGQQQVALKLHKNFKLNKYLFWAIMSLVLQAENAPASQSGIFLELAERMMDKAVKEGKLEQTEEVHLYLIVLLAQNKFQAALDVLEGDLGKKCKEDVEINRIRSDLLLKTSNWIKAIEMGKKSLTESNPDDWNSYNIYLESYLHLLSEPDKNENGSSSVNLDEAREFLYSLQKSVIESSDVKRGPFLAELKLEKYIVEKLKDCKPAKEIDTLIVDYFLRFGSKDCCFEDLQPYLKEIHIDSAKKIIEKFKATIDESCDDEKSKIQNIKKNVNIHKFERYLNLLVEYNEVESIQYVNKLWHSYKDSLQYGTKLLEAENQYGDDFVLLCSHVLIDLYKKFGKSSYIFQAIFLLEAAVKKSNYNFQFKLPLIRLYQTIGIFDRPLELYKSMDIKHVQLDTMSHYIVSRSFSSGFFDESTQACYDTLPIYRSNELETPEMIVQAFKFTTFSKIQEFVALRKELENSLQKALVDREMVRLEILIASKSNKQVIEYFQDLDVSELSYDDGFCTNLRDNRDFVSMPNYNPDNKPTMEEITRVSSKLDKLWLKLFSIIPRILKCIHVEQNADNVKQLVEELEKILTEEIKGDHNIMEQEMQLGNVIVKLGRLFITVKEIQNGQKEFVQNFDSIAEELVNAIKASEPVDNSQIKLYDIKWLLFHQLTSFFETCNYALIGIGVLNETLNVKNKKSGLKALAQKLQNMSLTIKNHFTYLKKQLICLNELFKNDEEDCDKILLYIKSEPHVEFCDEKESVPFVKEILGKINTNWKNNIQNMIKEIDSKFESNEK
ncbi:N-acetyltransferase B complex non catalytic subunit-domain-containing protein [Gigaspora rosea]|uniref:N-acetyltransferase B complex non catalytic subunit-domain-containing protein n=1 Tax=Gigaspora rosea TaxID=44941 RepID=A0A397UJC8_9GLOM|nr:N-acetyltransferase B complex non catalytic subunit-domain-containing protein [Gigaspora rosea]